MVSGCKHHKSDEGALNSHAVRIRDAQASAEIGHVEEQIAQQLEHLNLDAESHDESTESLRQFVSTLASADVHACPNDFKQQFVTSLSAWQKVLTTATAEDAYLNRHPEEEPEKGGRPSVTDQELAIQVNSALQQALAENKNLREAAARYGVRWR